MRIALISLNQAWEDSLTNQNLCSDYLKKAVSDHADVVVFPEMTLTGFSMNIEAIAEKPSKLTTLSWFSEQAKMHQLAIVMGYVEQAEDNRGLNRSAYIDATGTVLCNYVKIHPFSYSKETEYYHKGDSLGVCENLSTIFGLTICYDLRFPQLYQLLSKTCEIIFVIASWPEKRIEHWHTLLRARAIENQVFMVGVNRTGVEPSGLSYTHSSCVYNPFGDKIAPVSSAEGYDLVELSLSDVQKIRESYPFRHDRRDNLYRVLEAEMK
jgi:predicted amidohydrolase